MRTALPLVAALAALAGTGAAAKEPHYYTIKLTNASIAQTSGATGKDEKIPITSFMWSTKSTATGRRTYEPATFRTRVGDASPASGGGTNEMRMDDSAGKERTKASSDMAMKGSKIGENAAIGQAIGDMAANGNEDRAQATGKRQHKPMLARGYYDSSSPPQRGTLTVLASGGSCRVGARYPSLQLSGGGKTHVLQGVTVTSCGGASAAAGDGLLTEEISFSYQTIKFEY